MLLQPLQCSATGRNWSTQKKEGMKFACDMYGRSNLYFFLQTTNVILPTCYKNSTYLLNTHTHSTHTYKLTQRSLLDVKSAISDLIVTTNLFLFVFLLGFLMCAWMKKFLKNNHLIVFILINFLVSAKTKEKRKYKKDNEENIYT
jgi:hypothetical protein